MTQSEVSIIKNLVLDATEAYVEARLKSADFVKTQIGVVVGYTETSGKFYHRVKCNITSNQSVGNITYDNVLSVGNIPFPADSVVFLIIPNAQYSNQFILGKLDTTPCHIIGGSIDIGDGNFTVDSNGNVVANNIIAKGGQIAGFEIGENELTIADTKISPTVIGCGEAGYGLVNLVGGVGSGNGYIQLSVSGDPNNCYDGIRIYSNGDVKGYRADGSVGWVNNLFDIPTP